MFDIIERPKNISHFSVRLIKLFGLFIQEKTGFAVFYVDINFTILKILKFIYRKEMLTAFLEQEI